MSDGEKRVPGRPRRTIPTERVCFEMPVELVERVRATSGASQRTMLQVVMRSLRETLPKPGKESEDA